MEGHTLPLIPATLTLVEASQRGATNNTGNLLWYAGILSLFNVTKAIARGWVLIRILHARAGDEVHGDASHGGGLALIQRGVYASHGGV